MAAPISSRTSTYNLVDSFYRDVLKLLPANRAMHILDLGCGTGFLLHALQIAGYSDIHGIDADQGQIRIATEHRLQPEWIAADEVRSFLRENSSWDAVFLMDVLGHVPKDDQISSALQSQRASGLAKIRPLKWRIRGGIRYGARGIAARRAHWNCSDNCTGGKKGAARTR